MEYTALWGPKGFIISPTKVVPLRDLSTSFSVKSDTGNDTSGSATTNNKGLELETISLSTIYVRGAGVNPRGQIAEWKAQVGKAHPLYINGERFGPKKLMLKSVSVSDILLNNAGEFLQCAVALTFEESANTVAISAGTTTTASNPSASQAAAVYNSMLEQKNEALNSTAPPADRAAKKPSAAANVAQSRLMY